MELDSTYLQQVRSNGAYDYISEINDAAKDAESGQEESFGHSSARTATELIDDFDDFVRDHPIVFNTITVILLAVGAFFLIRHILRTYIWGNDSDLPDNKAMGSDTIEGHDWDKEMHALMEQGAYGEVVVLCYLRWLEKLNADNVIRFDVSKTPGMFIAEVEDYKPTERSAPGNEATAPAPIIDQAEILAKTRTLTNHYLRIRYGHKSADHSLAKQLMSL